MSIGPRQFSLVDLMLFFLTAAIWLWVIIVVSPRAGVFIALLALCGITMAIHWLTAHRRGAWLHSGLASGIIAAGSLLATYIYVNW